MSGNKTWTFTFSERVENHVGMETIGQMVNEGSTIQELEQAQQKFTQEGFKTELINLQDNLPILFQDRCNEACILIIRNGVEAFVDKDLFMKDVVNTEQYVDKKAWMKGRIVNKLARYNLCYADFSQDPDYENKKGTVLEFTTCPNLEIIRNRLHEYFGKKAFKLFAELNFYYDITKTGIGYHGDGERRIVIGVRMGSSMSLHYQWFHQSNPIGDKIELLLHGGDIYAMSNKATGNDWKKKKIPTLRHAAGAKKYTTI